MARLNMLKTEFMSVQRFHSKRSHLTINLINKPKYKHTNNYTNTHVLVRHVFICLHDLYKRNIFVFCCKEMENDYKKRKKQISIRFTFFNCIALFPKSAIILPK